MKTTYKYLFCLVSLILLSVMFTACTERKCYREHLKVYTDDYIATCRDGYWEEECLNDRKCSVDSHGISEEDANRLDRLSATCPILQCIKNDCKCSDALTREEVGARQLEDLLDELLPAYLPI